MEESPRADESEIKMESPMEEGREADVTETDKDCDLTDQDFICENSEFPWTGFSATRLQLIEEQQRDPDIHTWKAREDMESVDIKNGVLC